MKSSVCCPASASVSVEALISSRSPEVGVHLDDDLVHLGELLLGGPDDEIGTFGDDLELVVGDERCDLDDDVAVGIESGHLEIHPDQHVAMLMGRRREASADACNR